MARRFVPLALLAAAALYALVFDLTLPARLPTDADYRAAADVIRREQRPGDLVLVHPWWADHVRAYVDVPVRGYDDPADEDYVGVSRVWLVGLPRSPGARWREFVQSVQTVLHVQNVQLDERHGALALARVEVGLAPAVDVASLLPGARIDGGSVTVETREVDGLPRRCLVTQPRRPDTPLTIRFTTTLPGALRGRAGLVGNAMYEEGRPPVQLRVTVDGLDAARVDVPPLSTWQRWDTLSTPGTHAFALEVRTPDARALCLGAWAR